MSKRFFSSSAGLYLSLSILAALAAPLGTSFTYQGRLQSGNDTAAGLYDFRFTLHDALQGGQLVGAVQTNMAINVNAGLFVVSLDFGNVFDGSARWLEIAVRTNGSAGAFTTLSPRQVLAPTPHALRALNANTAAAAADLTGTLSDARLSTNIARLNSSPRFTGTVTAGAFVGNGAGLTNLDSAQLSGPLALAKSLIPGVQTNVIYSADGLALAGNYLYIANYWPGLVIVDVSNPAKPVALGSVSWTNYSAVLGRSVAVGGRYAYVASGTNGLCIFDVANPTNAFFLRQTNNGGTAVSVALSGNYAYLASGEEGVRVYNITTPATPTHVTRFNNVGFSHGVSVSGDYLYLANGTNGLRIFSLANPASPTFLAAAYDAGTARGVFVSGNYACVANGEAGFYIYSVANPSSPALVGKVTPPKSDAWAVAVSGAYAYVADGTNGLRAFDISTPAQPAEIAHAFDGNDSRSVVASAAGAWVSSGYWGVRHYQVAPSALAGLQTLPGGAVGIGGPPIDSLLDVEGDIHLNDHELFLRGGSDRSSGLGWYGPGKSAGYNINGPVLYGDNGGALGTSWLNRKALVWDHKGNIILDNDEYGEGDLDAYALRFGRLHPSGIAAQNNYYGYSGQYGLNFYASNTLYMALTAEGRLWLDPLGKADGSLLSPGIVFGSWFPRDAIICKQTEGGNRHGFDFLSGGGLTFSISQQGLVMVDPVGRGNGQPTNHCLIFGYDKLEAITSGQRSTGVNRNGLNFYTRGTNRLAITANGEVVVDPDRRNSGTVANHALLFGVGSGAGIASRQTAGGLQFYTGNQPRLSIAPNGNVGIGTLAPDSLLDVEGDIRLNDYNLFFRNSTDTWHGLGFYGGSKTFAGQDLNGPVLFGNGGGGLGSMSGTATNLALRWEANNRVNTYGLLSSGGDLRLNDNEIYLRGGSDNNHGLGWYGPAAPFVAGRSEDGPVLYGYNGGVLGTTVGSRNWTLTWNSDGNVNVRGTVNQNCDRNVKADFAPADGQTVLEKVVALPMQTWRYRHEPETTRHLGPVAQDFHAAFGLGADETHITTVDASGVALAAIQGLNQKLEAKEAEIYALKQTVQELQASIRQILEAQKNGK